MIKPFIASDLREVSPLVLAYIGDAVYEVYARCHASNYGAGNNNKLHKRTIKYVSAESQAEISRQLMDELTETEQNYFRRGKNSNPHASSKNASHADYMYATGFEALIGYLFMDNQEARMEYLLQRSFEIADGIKAINIAEFDEETGED